MIAVAQGYSMLEALGVTIGGIVGAVGVLTALTKLPGTRWIFRRLVVAPYTEWHDQRMDQKIADGIGLQADVVRQQVQQQIAPIAREVAQINEAVNNVGPDTPKLKDRVHAVEQGQAELLGEVRVVRRVVESLVQRP